MKSQQFYKYAFLLALAYIILFLVFPSQKEEEVPTPQTGSGIVLEATKKSFHPGETVKLRVKNNSDKDYTVASLCPYAPFAIKRDGESIPTWTTGMENIPCSNDGTTIVAGETQEFSLDAWHQAVGKYTGQYEASVTAVSGSDTLSASASFAINERGTLGKTWDILFYQPLYNLLIWLTSILANDLGWAIVALTIIIRLILLIPNQKALESQKRLQTVQPKIAEIQKKYEGDTKKIGEETMKLWKEHKVNPMGSCLPLLLQMPFLIALYYAAQHGLDQSSTTYLYEPLKNFPVSSIHSNFLGILDLSKPNFYVLPVVLAVLQWYQMHISLPKKKEEKALVKKEDGAAPDPMKAMNASMKYAMPLLIGVMSVSFPSGVSLYWGVSTLFGIAQQLWVNKMKN